MKQRGRKSDAALSVVANLPIRLLAPPADFSLEECEVWSRVVATKPSEWWDAGSIPLLSQYCRAAIQAELVADLVRQVSSVLLTDANKLGEYRELRKLQSALSAEMNSLARSMRLTQQSRYNAKNSDTASRKANGRKPWHHDVIDA